MNYTKGEWKARHPNNNDITIYTGEYGQGIVKIAQICEGYPNAEANARLIAAAPAMYEALKEITELAPRDKLRLPYAHQVVEIADKALAQAEGKMP